MDNILITGVTGSGASYLAERLCEVYPKAKIHGISRWHSTSQARNLENVADRIEMHECDLCDLSSITRALDASRPDYIFHLASHANVRSSFVTPLAVLQNNIMGTANFLEAINIAQINPIIQLCSTSEVYGQVDPINVPINEECPQKPASPYAVSKTTQDHLGTTYFHSYGLKIIITRMFSYFNPRRTDLFSTSFARQVALIEQGKQEKLLHGNLDSIRTLIDVRDAMEAYRIAVLKCKLGEVYNIGGQTTISVGDFLEVLIGKAKVKITTEVDQKLIRPSDVTLQIPDSSKFIKATDWHPQYNFEDSVEHLLDYWRSRV